MTSTDLSLSPSLFLALRVFFFFLFVSDFGAKHANYVYKQDSTGGTRAKWWAGGEDGRVRLSVLC